MWTSSVCLTGFAQTITGPVKALEIRISLFCRLIQAYRTNLSLDNTFLCRGESSANDIVLDYLVIINIGLFFFFVFFF